MSVDFEICERLAPEAPTALELEWKDRISADDFAIYSTKLELIATEAKQMLVVQGISSGIQGQDCGTGIYSASGDLAIGCVGTTLHLVTGQIPIKYILKHYKDDPTVGIHDGDAFFCNESIYGGIHNGDMLIIVPIFKDGELVAWTMLGAHEVETGASKPGGFVLDAKSRYEEGLKVPPLKIAENFRLKGDVMELFVNMTRDEKMMVGDTRAKTSCAFRVRERMIELIEDKGTGFVVGLMRRILEEAAEGARRKVAQLNDGVFKCALFIDIRGSQESISRINVTLTKKGDGITVDLAGTSPPSQSFLNTRLHAVRSLLVGDLSQFLFGDLPASAGILEPFEVTSPPNTVVNPPFDSPIAGAARLAPIVVNAIHVCLAKLAFDSPYREDICVPFGVSGRILSGGTVNQYGEYSAFLLAVPNGAGLGARHDMDGVDVAGCVFTGMADCVDSELDELQVPLLFLHRGMGCDQGGLGKFRGGTAISYGFMIHGAGGPFMAVYGPNTSRIPIDLGLFGGYAGGMAPLLRVRNPKWASLLAESPRSIPHSYHEMLSEQPVSGRYEVSCTTPDIPFANGDYLALMGASAGGYGDILERDPNAVMDDLRWGVISHRTARRVYKVVYDEATLRVDQEATTLSRNEERAARLERGRPYEEFEREWLQKRPTDEQLRLYGPWPDGVQYQA